MNSTKLVQAAVLRFVDWLNRYGETSYDHQSYFASDLGRRAKALYYKSPMLGRLAVAPMIFSEAFVPSVRRLFWKRERFPIADAHYATGFAFIAQTFQNEQYHERAVHFLEVLKVTRSPGYETILGIPVQLGNTQRDNTKGNSVDNDGPLCL